MKVFILILKIILAILILPAAIICGIGVFGLTVYLVEKIIFADREKVNEVNKRLESAIDVLNGDDNVDIDTKLEEIVKSEDNE